MRLLELLAKGFEKTHEYRAGFWVAMVPTVFLLGLESSIPIIFLYSTYANVGGDLAAWQARRAKEQAEGE